MSFSTQKSAFGRTPVVVVEIDVDICSLVYSTSPCTAAIGTTGDDKCFNTRLTCQDPENYTKTTKTLRFISIDSPPIVGATVFPCIKGVSIDPTRINTNGFSERSLVNISMKDFVHTDVGIDPYFRDRAYDTSRGTFWAKFKARNQYLVDRTLRVKTGYITDPANVNFSTDFETRTFFIEKVEGPDANGSVRIMAKDVLKLANSEKAKAPAASNGVLAADMTALQTRAFLDDVSEYASSGTVRIGGEIMTYTSKNATANSLDGLTRGTDGSVAETHSTGNSVQQCLRYTAQAPQDVIEDLLVNYANISSSFLPTTDWDTEAGIWLNGYELDRLITEPTGVKTLVEELLEQTNIFLWWSDLDQEIKLKVVAPPLPGATPTALTDDNNILEKTLRTSEEEKLRYSRILYYYNVINPAEDLDEISNYANLRVRVDADAESADEYNSEKQKLIKGTWVVSGAISQEVSGRFLSRFRDPPRMLEFEIDMKDSAVETGDFVTVDTRVVQDQFGANDVKTYIVMESSNYDDGSAKRITALEFGLDGNYRLIGPNTLVDYTSESASNQATYLFISNDEVSKDVAFFSNGDPAHQLI